MVFASGAVTGVMLMTTNQAMRLLQKHEEAELCKFDRIKDKMSSRQDLHAFLLLHKLQPSDDDIIGGANHDEIYLSIDLEKLAAVISEEQIIDLLRCGVQYDRQIDGLMMFV